MAQSHALVVESWGDAPAWLRWREEDLPEDPVETWSSTQPGGGLVHDRRGWIPTVRNVSRALRTQGWWRCIAWDTFREEVVWSPWRGSGRGQWRSWADEDYTRCRIELERCGFAPVGRELMRDCVRDTAMRRQFDSAQLWLGRLRWDGAPRVEQFLMRYCGVADSAYSRAVGLYMWTAQAARVLVPGAKCDYVPVLVGTGGAGKTSMIAAIAPAREFCCRISLNMHDADLGRRLRGKLCVEIAELRGLHTRDSESIKDFLSGVDDSWIPKYLELARSVPRRFVFYGTTDKMDFLTDDAGNLRRWLPVQVGRLSLEAVVKDREQLWAEAADRFVLDGVMWQTATQLAGESGGAREEHEIEDSWTEAVLEWADSAAPEDILVGDTGSGSAVGGGRRAKTWLEIGFTTREALTMALGFEPKSINKGVEMRFAGLMRQAGLSHKRGSRSSNRRTMRVWRALQVGQAPA